MVRMVTSSPFNFSIGEQVKVVLSGKHFGRVGKVQRRTRMAKTKMPPPVPENVYWIVFEEEGKESGFDFETTDEEHCHELETTVARHVLGRFVARPPMSVCPDGPNEMMWTREFGRGRIFYNSLGHDVATWQNEAWQRLVIQGIQWAAGRK